MEPIIEVKNLGKKYNINHQQGRYLALRDVIAGVFKNPFKFFKDKAKQVVGIETTEEYWALKDVNFTVNKGEVIGIIGRNGAGKSTLLKILSQITPPTTGEIKIRGRVGSLLEVGTGFHPELTGRENIMLNGAILGMAHKEIARKFDQIVEFAGIDKFLDTPVKYYSSGMYVRLAFSVAAHMEPDILIIDEVLAVGDAEFQKKCLGKMDEITKQDGRTILFVSHNMEAIEQLCKKTILLENGKMLEMDKTEIIIDRYLKESIGELDLTKRKRVGSGEIKLTSISLVSDDKKQVPSIGYGDSLNFLIKYRKETKIENITLSLGLYSHVGHLIANITSGDKIEASGLTEEGEILVEMPNTNLLPGNYKINISAHANGSLTFPSDYITDAFSFSITSNTLLPNWVNNSILLNSNWKIIK